jgi:hypothetical protein
LSFQEANMADYFTPAVLQPVIPDIDMTPLERLILTEVFQSDPDGDGLYLYAESALNEMPSFTAAELAAALEGSAGVDSHAAALVRTRLAASDGPDTIEFDLTGELAWETIIQDIVRRSATIDQVIATSAFTCSKMRPDGFGGMVVLITADQVLGKSTEDMLCDLMDQVEHGDLGAAPGHGHHVLLRLAEEHVRATIEVIFETEAPEGLGLADVTDADIREASLGVKAASDLSHEESTAAFNAALGAIRIAAERKSTAR